MALANLGRVHVYEGEEAKALPYLARSLEQLRPVRHREGATSVLELIAQALRGDTESAVALLARAAALREAANAPAHGLSRTRVEELRRTLTDELGEEPFEQLWEGSFDPELVVHWSSRCA